MMDIDNSDDDWSDISEEELDHSEDVLCLFCEKRFTSVDECFSHMIQSHQFSMLDYIQNHIKDFYGYIKFVNYVRREKIAPSAASTLSQSVYQSEEFLMPVLADDSLLQYDVDTFLEKVQNSENDSLVEKLALAEKRADNAENALHQALSDLAECRNKLSELFLGSNTILSKNVKPCNNEKDDSEAYFSSYAHYGIHEEMLKDNIRTLSYQSFISDNKNIFKNANVLDVGCGTSILSMFAAKAGAKSVTGVDNSEIAYNAIDIVKENQLEHVIKIVKCRAEDLKIDEKVDIIISEWMGYFLVFESMLDTVIYCRDYYLKDGGCVFPDKCSIKLIGLQDNDLVNDKLEYWKNVYGFRMSCMRNKVLKEPLIHVTNVDKIITKPYNVIDFDLMTMTTTELDFDKKFILEIQTPGELNAIAGYFDIGFEKNLENPVKFSTSPFDTATHWKQTIFILEKSFPVTEGDVMNGRIICKKNKKDNRALDIAIIIYDETYRNVQLKQFFVLC